jgi:kinesin family protein 5
VQEAAGDDAPAGPDSDSEGGSGGAGGREALREALCSALCSLSELLMGAAADAADEADGEGGAEAALAASPALGECEELLGEARALCGASPEPLQALCSLRRLQGRDEEALQALRQSMALWFQPDSSDEEDEDEEEGGGDGGAHGRREPAEPAQQPAPPHAQGAPAAEAAAAEAAGSAEGSEQGGSQSEEEEEEMDLDPGAPLPSYEFRFECAKLLIELDDSTDAAAQVLEGLLEENDGVPEVWLLLAVAHRASGALAAAAATAEEGCALVRKLGVPAGDEVAAALAELVAEVAAEAGEAGPPAGGGDRK